MVASIMDATIIFTSDWDFYLNKEIRKKIPAKVMYSYILLKFHEVHFNNICVKIRPTEMFIGLLNFSQVCTVKLSMEPKFKIGQIWHCVAIMPQPRDLSIIVIKKNYCFLFNQFTCISFQDHTNF